MIQTNLKKGIQKGSHTLQPKVNDGASKILQALSDLSILFKEEETCLEEVLSNLKAHVQPSQEDIPMNEELISALKTELPKRGKTTSQTLPENVHQVSTFQLTNKGTLRIKSPSEKIAKVVDMVCKNNPVGFATGIQKLHQAINSLAIPQKKDIILQLETYGWLGIAQQELLQEEHGTALNHPNQKSGRNPKYGFPEISAQKNALLATIVPDQKTLSQLTNLFPSTAMEKIEKSIAEKTKRYLQKTTHSLNMPASTQEVFEACELLTQKCLEKVTSKEDLHPLRTLLMSLHFQEAKKHRSPSEHPCDRILPAPSKFHKDALLFVRHPLNERAELVAINSKPIARPESKKEAPKKSFDIQGWKNKLKQYKTDNPTIQRLKEVCIGVLMGMLLTWGVLTITQWGNKKTPEVQKIEKNK